jgi:pimeloyl-ACP methyl ester carboxylesterase
VSERVRIATTEGEFAALRAGRRGAPLVLVLHGFPDHPPTFAAVIEPIAAAGYDVVAPWLRGYGQSVAGGPYEPERLARDVLAITDACGDAPAFLVGHDWGAVITYAACAIAPARVRAAVTIAVPHPMAFLRSFVRTAQLARSWYMFAFQIPGVERLIAARDMKAIDLLWSRWSPGASLPAAARAALRADLAAHWPAPIDYYRDTARKARGGIRGPLTEAIEVPVLQLQGADDGCIAPSACRGQARWFRGDFREEVLPGVGHFAQVEAPARVADRAISWIASH